MYFKIRKKTYFFHPYQLLQSVGTYQGGLIPNSIDRIRRKEGIGRRTGKREEKDGQNSSSKQKFWK
jgi:hypothetical protein